MAKFRMVHTTFWEDSKVVDNFTPEDKFFYLYLLTNPKCNQLGAYELSLKQMCWDTGYNQETIKQLLDRFENIHKVIVYDFDTKEIFLKNWHKYNWFESYNTKKCIDNEFSLIKSEKIKELISPLYAPYQPLPSNNKKKNKNNNKNNKKKKEEKERSSASTTTPPTLTEIISYFSELGYKKDDDYCENFKDYYDLNGWEGINWKNKFKVKWCKEDEKNGNIKKREMKEYFWEDEESGEYKSEMRYEDE